MPQNPTLPQSFQAVAQHSIAQKKDDEAKETNMFLRPEARGKEGYKVMGWQKDRKRNKKEQAMISLPRMAENGLFLNKV